MTSEYNKWHMPYEPAKEFNKKVAYFSMEFGIHQALKIYSGGLGFLAGSHMRSGYELKQNMIGIGMLWKYGYYDQGRNGDQTMKTNFIEKNYTFLEDSGLEVEVKLHDNPSVKVRAMVLKPEIFGTVPMYLLTTDVEGNDYLSKTITNHLYDSNYLTRISQSIVLGIGGAKIVEALGGAEMYHLNEGHALPAFYYLRDQGVKKNQMVFTTHTPEKAGNEERDAQHLNRCGFFGRYLSEPELQKEVVNGGMLNYTVSALRMAKVSNAVSKLHAKVSQDMWKDYPGISKIIPITNAQNQKFWQDEVIEEAHLAKDAKLYRKRKIELKKELFDVVLNQTNKLFDPNTLTIVWARRFAGYKRADLLLQDLERFEKLINNEKYPVQIIWAGKPYPYDFYAIDIFNHLVHYSKQKSNLAVLVGYEIELSRELKCGSDIWLNTPRITREASGTSGMTAAMNGSVNVSSNDGWMPEFAKDGKNSFVFPVIDQNLPTWDQDKIDCENLYDILENKVLPTYYDKPKKWQEIVFNSIDDVLPQFGSNRMAKQYYEELYK
ncbi:alpha-glucan family phosphorylase [Maribacter sp. TH_r10]|uniref:Alpha-glucan family phosphorylase n=1 Tax=Maribacter luteus TaxID=2594478 RepID=A0A6I2MKE0_9FLAO|nr:MULTISPECIES: alpha-glucan family phosphorylase [Maribacter]MDV7137511.1 alpha-glucan family phosphorylase [Maribacter sp. TH_r10]MRX64233.1 alpha-glucan family phosphorylase [Maribacter luteus]